MPTTTAMLAHAYHIVMIDPHDPALDQSVGAFLRQATTAALASVTQGGGPCCCNVQFVCDPSYRLYFVSSPTSEHSRNIAGESRVAVTIYGHVEGPAAIHGVQLRGHALALADPTDRTSAWALYTHRYPHLLAQPELAARLAAETFYRVTPTWIRWIDNRRHFGFKQQWGDVM